MLSWFVHEGIERHVSAFDKSARSKSAKLIPLFEPAPA
jgi:hypothetical protein